MESRIQRLETVYTSWHNHISQLANITEGHLTITNAKIIDEVMDITKAKSVFEIGFNAGHSSVMWLEAGCKVTSMDIGNHDYTYTAIKELYKESWERFNFILGSSKDVGWHLSANQYDLIFIDGEHGKQVEQDIEQCILKGKPKYLFLDDYHEQTNTDYINAVYPATLPWVEKGILERIKYYPNGQGLFKVND